MALGNQTIRGSVPVGRPRPDSAPAPSGVSGRITGWLRWLSVAMMLSGSAGRASGQEPATPLVSLHLQHEFRVGANLLSGSQPEGDAAFAELARMGVRTVLSVDGAIPDIESAHRHGMRYVHLPFGYDGVPAERVAGLFLLAGATHETIYVHCHHGQHRGPTAVALMCLSSGHWTPEQAEGFLRQAGTSPDYPGLHRAVREFHSPSPETLAALTPLPEVSAPSSGVERMLAMDGHLDRLKEAQRAGWAASEGSPARAPGEEATLLWEQLRELERDPLTKERPPEYREKLSDAGRYAGILRNLLNGGSEGATPESRDEALRAVGRSCRACHQHFRD